MGRAHSVQLHGEAIAYQSVRTHRKAPAAHCIASYQPAGTGFNAVPGSFDYWLTERYGLYAALKRDGVVYGDIHHPP